MEKRALSARISVQTLVTYQQLNHWEMLWDPYNKTAPFPHNFFFFLVRN